MPGKMSKKKQQLITTAKSLFIQHGFKRITIEEICKTANVSKMTFYKYFSDKAAIANKIALDLVKEGFSAYDEINRLNISYSEKVSKMTQWRIEFASRLENQFIKEVLGMDTVMKEMRKRFIKNIEIAQTSGEINPELSPDFIWIVTEKLNELISEDSWRDVLESYSDFQKQLRQIYYHGIIMPGCNPAESDDK